MVSSLLRVRFGGQSVDTSRLLGHQAVPGRTGQRGEQVLPDVSLGERIEVPALQRQVLDHGPVKGRPLLAENRERGLQVLHSGRRQRRWASGMIAWPISSTIDQSNTAKGSDAAATMISSTPSSANRAIRFRQSSGVPV